MKRKFLALFMALSFCLMMPVTSNAAEVQDATSKDTQEQPQVEPRTTVRDTVEDDETQNGGNRYQVSGTVFRNMGMGQVATSFRVTYYYGGTATDIQRVNGYQKSCNAYAEVALQGGGANSFQKNQALTGASGESSATGSFVYTITRIEGTHFFACNGARHTIYSIQ